MADIKEQPFNKLNPDDVIIRPDNLPVLAVNPVSGGVTEVREINPTVPSAPNFHVRHLESFAKLTEEYADADTKIFVQPNRGEAFIAVARLDAPNADRTPTHDDAAITLTMPANPVVQRFFDATSRKEWMGQEQICDLLLELREAIVLPERDVLQDMVADLRTFTSGETRTTINNARNSISHQRETRIAAGEQGVTLPDFVKFAFVPFVGGGIKVSLDVPLLVREKPGIGIVLRFIAPDQADFWHQAQEAQLAKVNKVTNLPVFA